MCLVEREFQAEVEALSATRHENLVPLLGFCIRGRLRLLIYPYMANGSLHDWLHERRAGAGRGAPQRLDWRARLRIARGASRGVLYIHDQCKPQIVHRDIKSSNILLDEAGEARVADFGLARLILTDRTHVTTELVGTLGYIPPEYGQAWAATLRGDVYSFGVVLLELLTGRRPVETLPHGQQRELVRWVLQMRSQGRHGEVLDQRLRGNGDEAQMLYVLDLACLCVDSTPLSRPAIQDILVGTLGYIPPEYGQAWVATRRGDVYSFGVVLLELLTGRRPFEVLRHGQQLELVQWVLQMRSQGRHGEVLDQRLRGNGDEAQMLYVLDLACLCVDSTPLSRPAIQDIVILVLLLAATICGCAAACVEVERKALLSFLAEAAPRAGDGIVGEWQRSPDCCTWDGVGCGGDGEVTRLSLPGRGLGGTISPSIGNLTALVYLNLSSNSLSGPFPDVLFFLPNVTVVDVSNNCLSGELPSAATGATARGGLSLEVLDVSSNLLAGQFPPAIWEHTPRLVSLNASNNSFHGTIPSLCASCPSLAVLDLSVNVLSGVISAGFGNCSRLRVLSAGRNNLTGKLPGELFDVKPLQHLQLPLNQIEGQLDHESIGKLTNLVTLDLGYNLLTGGLPESISQMPKLEELRLANNNLTGTLPSSLSNWTSLRFIDLRSNSFVGDLTVVDFSGLANLTVFDVASNNFTGTIPPSIYTCTAMKALRVSRNVMGGQVSPEIGNLKELELFSLTFNSFVNISGMFWNLKSCTNLTALLLSYNFYGEALPDAGWIGDHIRKVRVIVLEKSALTGAIPSWLSKLQDLNILNLSGNRLTGPIPSWLGAMPKLYYVDLSGNQLSGVIPPSLMEMRLLTSEQAMAEYNPGHLILTFALNPDNGEANRHGRGYYQLSGVAVTLNFSDNDITGTISPEVGKLKTLQMLDVSYNNLSGDIPTELTSLARLQVLDLSWNLLTGTIPSALNKLNFLAVFNVAHNDLEGPIPTGGQFDAFPPKSFMGNAKLCGRAISVPCGNINGAMRGNDPIKHVGKRVIIAIVLGVCFGLVALVVFLGCVVITVRKLMSNAAVRDGGKGVDASLFDSMSELYGDCSKDTILFMSEAAGETAKSLTFLDILKATNNFSAERIIGSGGYGLVFLAELEDGTRLAVKKLNGDMCLVEREFQAEVEALSATRHENLVPLLGFYIRGQLRLLIYRYMTNGSLHDWLHESHAGDGAPQQLDWRARLSIARDASRGVLHIHDQCKPQIVHRDIKSSNILLDKAGEARVADFGLARLILPDRTHVTTELVGTLGYIPPEYGQAWVATRRGDVYSFGVVLLELLTGRRPFEVLRHGQQLELVQWVLQMRSQGRHGEVLDQRLRGNGDEAQMLYVLDLACLCVDSTPLSRPVIQDIVSWLDNVQFIG
uniref:non-specific serine/threonine protein kinase n=1 Tax=Oryza meridionalis TaxID=40149 RepID=A0A0E0E5P6_9ORYZ